MADNAVTELKNILFWDNPMIGSVSRADGHSRAQTRQISPFRGPNRLLRIMVKARKAAGLTQRELADRLHKPQSFVAKYEGGERRIDVVEFLTVCQAIGWIRQNSLRH